MEIMSRLLENKKLFFKIIIKLSLLLLLSLLSYYLIGLGGLGVTCLPRDPRFAGLNPTEVDGFFSGRKNPEHKSSVRNFKLGVPSLRFQAR